MDNKKEKAIAMIKTLMMSDLQPSQKVMDTVITELVEAITPKGRKFTIMENVSGHLIQKTEYDLTEQDLKELTRVGFHSPEVDQVLSEGYDQIKALEKELEKQHIITTDLRDQLQEEEVRNAVLKAEIKHRKENSCPIATFINSLNSSIT